jgi:hypothetical protein
MFFIGIFKDYLKFFNRLYDITWFGAVYEKRFMALHKFKQKNDRLPNVW